MSWQSPNYFLFLDHRHTGYNTRKMLSLVSCNTHLFRGRQVRESSGRARALILQMADMLSALLRLHSVMYPNVGLPVLKMCPSLRNSRNVRKRRRYGT